MGFVPTKAVAILLRRGHLDLDRAYRRIVRCHHINLAGAYFFFSSRRRHTSSLCDWSSDVCSSDLDLTPNKILNTASFDNAIKVHMAMGGSTNAIIHVVAMARRAGVAMDMERFDQLSREIPVLANVRPSGKYLMEDFFYAGGLRALMQNLRNNLDLSCMTVNGKTIGENIEGAKVHIPDVIHSLNDPVYAEGATAVLKGNLAPNGCVIKPAAADKRFLKHRGKAIAFEDYNHMMREIERDDLDVTPDHILVLKNEIGRASCRE